MTSENNPNSHIEAYLDYYCSLSHAPGFAVLLKGQWGAGKTWFIKKYYEKLKAHKQKCLYVSLYGMTTFSEIEDAFFQQLHPVRAFKGMAIIEKIFKEAIKSTIKFDIENIKLETQENLPDYLKDADKSILIFDDLERCKIELGSILGYINYFVEHQDLKVVIIANEDELLKESSYKDIKEKLIGKTFGVTLDFEGALENFITVANNSDVRQFLSDNTQLLQKLYEEAESENLRILKQVVLEFDRIFEKLPDKAKNKLEFLKDILNILTVFSLEIKSGRLLPKQILELQEEFAYQREKRIKEIDSYSHQQSSSGTNENSEELTSPQNIVNKYPQLKLYDPFPSKVWWQAFFDKGIIDRQELEQSLSTSKYFQDKNTPDWVRLRHFIDLADDEFSTLLNKLESEYANRQFIDIGEITYVTGLLLNLSNVGLYSKSKEDILRDSKLYIDQLRENDQLKSSPQYVPLTQVIENIYGIYRGLEVQGRELDEFKEFSSYINKISEEARIESLPNEAKILLATMQSDIGKFYKMICPRSLENQDVSGIYSEIPILKHIDPAVFVEKIVSMNFEHQKTIGAGLIERYKLDWVNEKLIEELDWLKSVRDLLLEEADNRKGKLSGYRLEWLVENCLNPAIEKLEAKHSPA
ncbi:P-loop NTPase fold protein [Coleofasciculus sp. E2-BRE-01]|uniref:P-loop NTPase fold protein n=1 Tax=Coleofasciculus sp. E2-BRE-01 TaxID=3069524 RepID=UPI0032F0EFB8